MLRVLCLTICCNVQSLLGRYGNAVNAQRTVRGFAAAGFAGILLEDQVAPKSCGHVRGKAGRQPRRGGRPHPRGS